MFAIVLAINIGVVPVASIRKHTILLAATTMNVYRITVSPPNACVLILSKLFMLFWNLYYISKSNVNLNTLKDTTIPLRFHVRRKKEKEWAVQLTLNALAPVYMQSALLWQVCWKIENIVWNNQFFLLWNWNLKSLAYLTWLQDQLSILLVKLRLRHFVWKIYINNVMKPSLFIY